MTLHDDRTGPDHQGRRRIAFVLTQDRGGPVDVTVPLAHRLAELPGYTVRLFGPEPARGADLVAGLLEPTLVAGKGAAGAIRSARRAILAWQPDLVHAQDRRSGLVCGGLGLRRGPSGRRRSVVHTYHGVPDDVSQSWLEHGTGPGPSAYTRAVLAADAVVARSVDRTVVVAPPLRRFLVERLHVPGDRVVHIDNGLVLPDAAPPAGPVRRLLFVGLLVERKGVHLLLDALDLAARQGLPDQVTLTVVGDGPQRGALERQAQALGLTRRVRFLGYRSDVPDLLAQSDAFVLPSLMEQQPLVLIEALGAGLPTLATAVGGVGDLVGDVGLLVTPGDRGALAEGLVRLCALDAAAVGAAAALRARQRFGLDRCVQAHLDLYADLQRWRPVTDRRYVHPDDRADPSPAQA